MIPNAAFAIAGFILVIVFAPRALQDHGFKFKPKIPLLFGEFSKDATSSGNGGRGGSATATGVNSTAIGGKGGAAGIGGNGGDGGGAYAAGDGSFVMGGEGGEAGQIDRGGNGGRGPLQVLMEDYPERFKEISEQFGITEEMAEEIGRGGDGSSRAQ